MNKHVYIIQAHKNPEQLLRLIKVLNGRDIDFYIHIDLKVSISQFSSIIVYENVKFISDRIDCIWGDFSQVKATLNLINAVRSNGYDANTRITFLSGQDYPIKSKKEIEILLNENPKTSFIDIDNNVKGKITSQHKRNFKAFKINHSNKRSDFSLVSIYHFKSMLMGFFFGKLKLQHLKYVFKRRKLPKNLVYYKGSNWWSFNYLVIEQILNFYKENENELQEFFKMTFCPDEIFFQTILIHLKLKHNNWEISPSLTYANWTRKSEDLPVTFQKDDINELLTQSNNKLYARKFDSDIDNQILNELDKIVIW